MTLSGRSLCGVLVDSSVTIFKPLPTTLPKLAEALVRELPFIGMKDFKFLDGSASVKVTRKNVQVNVGDSVFDVLKRAATSQGYLFWCEANGALIFGKPRRTGESEYRIIGDKTGNTNYIEGSSVDSIVDRHSVITVVGESQADEGNFVHIKSSITSKAFPFHRPMILSWNDEEGPALQAAQVRREAEEAAALKLNYVMKGHAQGDKLWRINRFVRVDDVPNNASGVFRIVRRTFSRGRDDGTRTTLDLEPIGGAFA